MITRRESKTVLSIDAIAMFAGGAERLGIGVEGENMRVRGLGIKVQGWVIHQKQNRMVQENLWFRF
jgi:hypothetical protein